MIRRTTVIYLSMYTVQFLISNDTLYNSDIFIWVHFTGFLCPMIRCIIVIYLSMYTVQVSYIQ